MSKRARVLVPATLLAMVGVGGGRTGATSQAAECGSTPGATDGHGCQGRRRATSADLASLHSYLHGSWRALTRTAPGLPAEVAPRFPNPAGPALVYISRRENVAAVSLTLASLLPPDTFALLNLRELPTDLGRNLKPGLLYLPHPFVVPGPRVNEMYGGYSYFIVRGLIRDGQSALAQDVVDDALYEATTYGKVLSANRTDDLGRSQPAFLTEMIRAVYTATRDRAWLASTLPGIRAQYRYWTTEPHLAGTSGLSRYHAMGSGPVAELQGSGRGVAGQSRYGRLRAALRADPQDLEVAKYYDRRHDRLTSLGYVADRSVGESGFDSSDRFGRFSLGILDYAPVCLNSLLYAMERDVSDILTELGNVFEAQTWAERAAERQRRIGKLLWSPEGGLFADYDFVRGTRRWYPFATTFMPLWVGLASPEQARRVAAVALPLLLKQGGLMTSTTHSGNDWDAPFAWAPLQLVAVEGLRRYGLEREADEISLAFLGTVLRDYVEHGTTFEKYDLEGGEADVSTSVRTGEPSSEVGFGWTNGVVMELEAELEPSRRWEIVRAANRADAPLAAHLER